MHVAQAMELEGERLFYDGNVNKAKSTLQQALLTSARSKDPETTLIVRAMLAEVTVAAGASRGAVPELRKLAQEADARGLKDVSLQCSLSLVQALINARDYRNAAEEADRVRRMSDKMGLKLVGARTRYLQGEILRATGKSSEAAEQEKQARQILHDVSEESHADSLLKRADLRPILSQAAQ
jgi:thioredoxin-like negative regulator of GroEL